MNMNHHHYFNRIELSSVNPVYDNSEENREEQDSIINQLDYFCTHEDDESPIVKIQSFVYAEQVKNSGSEGSRRDVSLSQANASPKDGRYAVYRKQEPLFQSKQYTNNKHYKLENQNVQTAHNQKKSIKEQLMEQNKILQERLKANKHGHRVYQSHAPPQQYFRVKSNQPQKIESTNSKTETKAITIVNEHIVKIQEQYTNSSSLKFYNFIMKELPSCPKCQGVRTHAIKKQQSIRFICRKCESSSQGQIAHPFIGILYDLQTKIRFQQDLQLSQSILEGFNKQIEALKKEINKIESIIQKITIIKNVSRKKYKQLNQVKYFIKKNLSKLNTQHILELQMKIPAEYLEQVQRWRQIDQMYEDKWKHIYSSIYRMVPLYLHDHTDSKILSGLYKILNYQKNQEVKLSVSQHIKFPIKQMESVVFMVDGTYNLPIFQNIKHLQMQFQNKKTQRELSLLFSNLPRQIHSLGFKFNHKLHSHISAQNFPFLKYIAPVISIKKLNLKIENVKDYGDVLRLPQLMSEKIQFRLTITKHLFIREQLNLPYNYYEKLLEKLGPNLVVFQLRIPQAVDSTANINYEKLMQKGKLCFFVLERGEKQKAKTKNLRILQSLNEQALFLAKKKENTTKKLILQRNKVVKMLKTMACQKVEQKELVIDSIAALL